MVDVSRRTVTRFLNANGYYYLQARKKGLLTEKDKKIRLKFVKWILKEKPKDFWCKNINFYLDRVGFVYKRNPKDQALAPNGRVWRKRSKGLVQDCTAKGQACGTGGKYVKLIVTISYGRGVTCAKRYESMNGELFAGFIVENFENIIKAGETLSRMWVRDGDPSQKSAKAKKAMMQVNAEIFSIPARSPDMNPIENVF